MSYEAQNFNNGDILTASELNTMDSAIAYNSEALESINNKLDQILNTTVLNYKVISGTFNIQSDQKYQDGVYPEITIDIPSGAKFCMIMPTSTTLTSILADYKQAIGKDYGYFAGGFVNAELTDDVTQTNKKTVVSFIGKIYADNDNAVMPSIGIDYMGQSYLDWPTYTERIVDNRDKFKFLVTQIHAGEYQYYAYYFNGDTIL